MSGIRVALAGGGTGGHVVPGLHLLDHARRGSRWESVSWFGTGRVAERAALGDLAERAAPIPAHWQALPLEKRGGGAPSRVAALLRTAPATMVARRELKSARVEVVLGLGGLVQLPVVLAARSLGIPVALLEVNAVMGTTTRRLAPLAGRVFHAWRSSVPATGPPRHLYTGPPLAPAFAEVPGDEGQAVGGSGLRAELGIESERPLLLVLGGSQGAAGLNRFVADRLSELLDGGVDVLHQVGPERMSEAAPLTRGYKAVEFVSDVHSALSAATIVLCRGGASTLAEVAAMRCPAWVVPYPHHADMQQERNARELGSGVRIVPEAELTVEFARELACAAGAEGASSRSAMSAALAEGVPQDAARAVLDALEEFIL